MCFCSYLEMVRNYKRKTDRGKDNSRSSTSLSEAINEIKSGKLKTSVASRAYNVTENPDAVVEKPDAVSSDVPYSPPSSPPDNHLRMNS